MHDVVERGEHSGRHDEIHHLRGLRHVEQRVAQAEVEQIALPGAEASGGVVTAVEDPADDLLVGATELAQGGVGDEGALGVDGGLQLCLGTAVRIGPIGGVESERRHRTDSVESSAGDVEHAAELVESGAHLIRPRSQSAAEVPAGGSRPDAGQLDGLRLADLDQVGDGVLGFEHRRLAVQLGRVEAGEGVRGGEEDERHQTRRLEAGRVSDRQVDAGSEPLGEHLIRGAHLLPRALERRGRVDVADPGCAEGLVEGTGDLGARSAPDW